jgi:hypothetical protein
MNGAVLHNRVNCTTARSHRRQQVDAEVRNFSPEGLHLPDARKQFEVPPAAARSFFQDMRAFFAEKNSIKADESRPARSTSCASQGLNGRSSCTT